jgi:hypothetical protein
MRNGSEPATAAAAPPPQETALAGAATPTQATRAMPALTSIFVIRTGGCKFSKPAINCFGLAIDITTLLSASGTVCTWRSSILLRMPDSQEQTHRRCWLSLSYCNIGCWCPRGASRSGRFDVRLLAPKRQRCGKLACGLASQCRVRRHDSLALSYQQRATQNWVKMSWSTGAADAGAAE